MSSKILFRSEQSSEVEAMVWEQAGEAAVQSPAPVTRFGGGRAPAEAQALRNQMVRMEQEAERRVQEAFDRGLAQGFDQGRAQAAAQLDPVIARMKIAVQDLAQARPRLHREAERDLVELAIKIARRILHRECHMDPAALQGIVQVALERLERQDVHRLRVHASQAELVRRALAGISPRAIEVVAVRDCEPGALLFETSRGKLDAGIETQLEEIERGLVDLVNR